MKSLLRIGFFVVALVVLALPVSALPALQHGHFEGIEVIRTEGHNVAFTRVEIYASKHISTYGNSSSVRLVAEFGGNPAWQVRYSIDTTFSVPLDADYLEVSDDLGWGGLDAEVVVPVQVLTCTDTVGGNCTTSMSTVPVTIHLYGLADQPVVHSSRLVFERRATFTGTVTIGSRAFAYNGVWGRNYADQYIEES